MKTIDGLVGVYLFIYSITMEYELFRGRRVQNELNAIKQGKEKRWNCR